MKFVAAAVQMLASDDKAANLKEAGHWLRAAVSQGARLAALPEVFIWRGEKRREREFAETIPGPSSTALAKLARELRIYLLGGSILEEIPGSGKAYNTSLLFDPKGTSSGVTARSIFSMSIWPTALRCASRRPANTAVKSWP